MRGEWFNGATHDCRRMRSLSLQPLNMAGYAALSLTLLALGGCKPDKKTSDRSTETTPAAIRGAPAPAAAYPAASVGGGAADRARMIAEQTVRSVVSNKNVQFRGLQVWSQATPQHWAVCGQASPFADDENIFVPFVTVVTLSGDGHAAAGQVEAHVGTSTAEANRVYVALVADCYDKGGPVPGALQGFTPMPPVPDTIPNPHEPVVAAAAPAVPTTGTPATGTPGLAASAAAVVASPASGSVTMRQSANVHATPHGPSVRVVAAGTVMHVFGQAGGGWYQVGDGAPWGWVHESMIVHQ